MSELSPDARDLVAQARKQGSAVLGPSADQRAQLRERLAPLWAAEVVQPRAASGLRWKLGSLVIVAGLGMLAWLNPQSRSVPLPAAGEASSPSTASDQRLQSASATTADDEAGAAPMNRAGMAGPASHGQLPESSARGASEPCPRGSSLRAGVCTQGDAPSPSVRVAPQPLATAAPRKAKRAAPATPATSLAAPGKLALQPTAAVAGTTPNEATSASSAKEAGDPGEDLLAGLGLDPDETASQRPVMPVRKDLTRLPLTAAAERSPERAVQTDAVPGPPSIDGELELLGAAQTALQKQRPSRALSLLQEHAFRFPTGAMLEERMAMQALALCALQRRHAAQTVLSNLEARGSKSQLLPRVRNQCGL